MKITLKTLPEATAQQVFDQVSKHLLTQGCKSMRCADNRKTCAYRGLNNTMCAAGCLIDDSEYKADMEGYTWYSLISNMYASSNHEDLIRHLQMIHDNYEPNDWRRELKALARRYYLNSDHIQYVRYL